MIYFYKIDLRLVTYTKGAFGLVVRCDSERALKLFFKRSANPATLIRDTFNGEVNAYNIASSDLVLAELTPKFYGCAAVGKILDEAGEDVSDRFELAMAYLMEWKDGDFVKFRLAPPNEQYAMEKLFRTAGIRHIRDASCLICEGQIKCLVDFSIDEIEEYWE